MELVWLYVVLIHEQHVAAETWLSLAKRHPCRQSSKTQGLWRPDGAGGRAGQVAAMEAVKRGAELAVLECQHQFHSRCWNCSTLQGLQVWGKATSQGTGESALTHTVSAFAVTCACSRGELHKCGCDHKFRGVSPEGFQWSGCSDKLYGIIFSQAFMDSSCEVHTCRKVPPFCCGQRPQGKL